MNISLFKLEKKEQEVNQLLLMVHQPLTIGNTTYASVNDTPSYLTGSKYLPIWDKMSSHEFGWTDPQQVASHFLAIQIKAEKILDGETDPKVSTIDIFTKMEKEFN